MQLCSIEEISSDMGKYLACVGAGNSQHNKTSGPAEQGGIANAKEGKSVAL